MALNCMIVDDELIARKSLDWLCKKHNDLNVVKMCENAKEALDVLAEEKIDLIFLDVEMPEMSGIEFLDKVVTLPKVILTTSSTEYAFEAFQYEVTDYLKKPFSAIRFNQAIEKTLSTNQPEPANTSNSNEIFIKKDGKYVRVTYDDILYFENAGDYIGIRTTSDSYVIHGTMKNLYARLESPNFLKVHRSYIVNLNKIKDIEDSTMIIGKKVIPISRAHWPVLMGRLNVF